MDNLLNSPGLPIGISLAVLFVTVWSLALYLTRRKGGIVVKTRQLQTEEHGTRLALHLHLAASSSVGPNEPEWDKCVATVFLPHGIESLPLKSWTHGGAGLFGVNAVFIMDPFDREDVPEKALVKVELRLVGGAKHKDTCCVEITAE